MGWGYNSGGLDLTGLMTEQCTDIPGTCAKILRILPVYKQTQACPPKQTSTLTHQPGYFMAGVKTS